MTQEDKMLLIKDLSARLPYAITVEHTSGFRGTLHDIVIHHKYDENDNVYDVICYTNFFGDEDNISIEYFKPYLFPLSSMTEEQRKEYDSIIYHEVELHSERYYNVIDVDCFEELQEFYHKNHLDYRNLIGQGLALDATNLNIY